jgi:dihydroxy-acid dehydratase
MPCDTKTTCAGCSCASTRPPPNIEDCEAELLALRKRTVDLEKTLAKLQDNPTKARQGRKLRSTRWFNNDENPGMTALYIERYLNYGITREELMAGKPVIGIAQSGSDIVPCNRHHLELAKRVREGIRSAGGIAFEFPTHPIQESSRRPTASLDRNLAYLGLVEILHAYPLDGVVLLTGCDKTTPAALMAAATVVCLLWKLICGLW